jgi:hypothetical protein
MSALGQKRTCAVQNGMSALCQKRTFRRSLDHLVEAGEQFKVMPIAAVSDGTLMRGGLPFLGFVVFG